VEENLSLLPEPRQKNEYEKIASVLKEALKSADATAVIPTVWMPEIVRKPAGLIANLDDAVRSYPQLRGRPSDKVKVPRLASVKFVLEDIVVALKDRPI